MIAHPIRNSPVMNRGVLLTTYSNGAMTASIPLSSENNSNNKPHVKPQPQPSILTTLKLYLKPHQFLGI